MKNLLTFATFPCPHNFFYNDQHLSVCLSIYPSLLFRFLLLITMQVFLLSNPIFCMLATRHYSKCRKKNWICFCCCLAFSLHSTIVAIFMTVYHKTTRLTTHKPNNHHYKKPIIIIGIFYFFFSSVRLNEDFTIIIATFI